MVAARERKVSGAAVHRLGRVDGDPSRAARLGHGDAAAGNVRGAAVRGDTARRHLIFGALLFVAGAFWAVRHYPYVHTRIAVWRIRSRIRSARVSGGRRRTIRSHPAVLFGTGYRLGHPELIPDVSTDYVYAAIAEDFGIVGAIVLLAIFLDLVRRYSLPDWSSPIYIRNSGFRPGATLGFQVVIIVGGIIGLLPLTGITLPFISYGGSSLVANFLLVALVWAMSARPRRVAT